MFWQDGDVISSGQTANDGNTIYYGSSDWKGLVTDHVAAIGGTTQNPPPTTSAAATTAQNTPPPTTPAGGGGSGTAPHWGQCGGIGWTGATVCASPYKCTYSNAWYSQCL